MLTRVLNVPNVLNVRSWCVFPIWHHIPILFHTKREWFAFLFACTNDNTYKYRESWDVVFLWFSFSFLTLSSLWRCYFISLILFWWVRILRMDKFFNSANVIDTLEKDPAKEKEKEFKKKRQMLFMFHALIIGRCSMWKCSKCETNCLPFRWEWGF